MIRKTSESNNLQTFLYCLKILRLHHQLDDYRNYIEQTLFIYKSIKSIHQDLYQTFDYIDIILIIYCRIEL